VLARLEASDDAEDLPSLLRDAWQGHFASSSERPGFALDRLRTALLDALRENLGVPAAETARQLLPALESVHGPVRRTTLELVRHHGAEAVPERYLFLPGVPEEVAEAALERARSKLDEKPEGLLPLCGGDQAVLLLEPSLTDVEVERLLLRMRSSISIDRLIEQSRERRPHLAFVALRRPGSLGVVANAVKQLGRRARPDLLAKLRRSPWTFSRLRDPIVDEILGPSELRLAAERSMKLATDATDVLEALALLPGQEARDGLRRLVLRINRLQRCAGDRLRIRTWNLLCSEKRLVRLLDRELVQAALGDEALDTVNRVLLLRGHPDADHVRAQAMWKQADLNARFALDVLRATGPAQGRLADEALERRVEARVDTVRAARLAAALAVVGCTAESLEAAAQIAADSDLPATVRAVACFVTGTAPHDDPPMERYRRWYETRRHHQPEPLIDLLSGAWQAQVVL
jgi:hypothetical protein